MSEGSTGRRLASARAVRKFPRLLPLIERGELHLTALAIVSGILTPENVDAVIAAVVGKTQREVEEVRVQFAPKPRVKDSIRRLPESSPSSVEHSPLDEAPPAMAVAVDPPPAILASASLELPLLPTAPPVGAPVVRFVKPEPTVVPLQQDAYKVQLTANKALVAKIDHVKAMMRHRNPKGDLATILDAALDLLIVKLEKERFGKTSRPRKSARPCKDGSVSREKRREVFERDGYQCTHDQDLGASGKDQGLVACKSATVRGGE